MKRTLLATTFGLIFVTSLALPFLRGGSERTPLHAPRDLLGLGVDEVLTRLGAPESATSGTHSTILAYRDAAGTVHEQALLLVDGIVVGSAAETPELAAGPAIRRDARYLGMTLPELLRLQGPAVELLVGETGTALRFGDGLLAFVGADGRVWGFETG